MSACPEILLRRMLKAGFALLRERPQYMHQVLSNLDRESQEQMIKLVREHTIPVIASPSNIPPVTPAVHVGLRSDRAVAFFLGDVLDHDVPDEHAYPGQIVGQPVGAAARTTNNGFGRLLSGPLKIVAADNDETGDAWVEVEGSPVKPRSLMNQGITLAILGGNGRGQIRGITTNTSSKFWVGAPWEPGKIPAAGSYLELRRAPVEFDGEPASLYDENDPRWYERRGHRRSQVVEIEVGGSNREMAIDLMEIVKGLLGVSSTDLAKRGVDNLNFEVSDLGRKSELFPDDAYVRTMSVTCEYELSVAVPLDAADSFVVRLWSEDASEPFASGAGTLGFQRPSTNG